VWVFFVPEMQMSTAWWWENVDCISSLLGWEVPPTNFARRKHKQNKIISEGRGAMNCARAITAGAHKGADFNLASLSAKRATAPIVAHNAIVALAAHFLFMPLLNYLARFRNTNTHKTTFVSISAYLNSLKLGYCQVAL